MASKPEQIGGDRRLVNAAWHWVKKQTSRHRRREERRDLDQPRQRAIYRGWVA